MEIVHNDVDVVISVSPATATVANLFDNNNKIRKKSETQITPSDLSFSIHHDATIQYNLL